jgi:hypothetical protein
MAFRQVSSSLWGAISLAWFAANPASASDLSPEPPASGWEFSFTPYGWMINVNGDVTARGHSADINEDFFQIVEKSDSLLAWMSYFEARKGRLALFIDVVWMDLSFPGNFQGSRTGPLGRASIDVRGNVTLDYQQLIIQSGVGYEVARWQRAPGSFTALDVMGSARYWSEDTDISLRLSGTATVDLERLGLKLKRSGRVAVARGNDLEWVDPVVGARLRHQIAPGKHLGLTGDVGGFGAGSEFSWQVVGTYGFDTTCLGQPLHMVLGYRALAVDYSETGRFGKEGLDIVQHGPVMGVTFNW